MNVVDRFLQGVITSSAAETQALARMLAEHLPLDVVIALHGDLGAGKTTFIQGLARGWDIAEPVTSPTFNLFTLYQGSRQLIHLDAYRLSSGADLDSLMIEDFMISPWCLAVEWPERIANALPVDAWHLFLEITETEEHSIRLQR